MQWQWEGFLQNLKQPSTWNAIWGAIGAVGLALPDGMADAISTFMIGASGLALFAINFFWKQDSQSKGTGDGTKQ